MCDIKNNDTAEILKGFRVIDNKGLKTFKDKDLAKLYARSTLLEAELKKYNDLVKTELTNRDIELMQFPDIKRKVYITEASPIKTVDMVSLFKVFKANKLEDVFFKCTTFVKSTLDKNVDKGSIAYSLLDENTKVEINNSKGKATSRKMSAKELKEAKLS